MIVSVQVTVPSDGSTAILEDLATEQDVEGADQFASAQGGTLYIKNTAAPTVLLGGPGKDLNTPVAPVLPLAQADPVLKVECGPDDRMTVKVQTTGTAGQVSVMKVLK